MKKNTFVRTGKFLCAVMMTFMVNAQAESTQSGVTVSDGYVRASIPGSDISSAYMRINNNNEKTVTLVRVTSKISSRIEMHQHSMDDGMMRMRQIDSISINGNSHVLLQPSGLHLMIFNLQQMLKHKDNVELTLHFSNEQSIVVQLPVQSIKKQHHH